MNVVILIKVSLGAHTIYSKRYISSHIHMMMLLKFCISFPPCLLSSLSVAASCSVCTFFNSPLLLLCLYPFSLLCSLEIGVFSKTVLSLTDLLTSQSDKIELEKLRAIGQRNRK